MFNITFPNPKREREREGEREYSAPMMCEMKKIIYNINIYYTLSFEGIWTDDVLGKNVSSSALVLYQKTLPKNRRIHDFNATDIDMLHRET